MDVGIEALATTDIDVACQWLSDVSINRWLTSEWRGRAVTPPVLAAALRGGRSRFFMVRADGVRVGLVVLSEIDSHDKVAMVWYLLGDREQQGQGVTTRAVGSLVRFALEEFGLRSVYAWIASKNVASRRVLEQNGFREVGTMRSATTVDGAVDDRVYFDIVSDVR